MTSLTEEDLARAKALMDEAVPAEKPLLGPNASITVRHAYAWPRMLSEEETELVRRYLIHLGQELRKGNA